MIKINLALKKSASLAAQDETGTSAALTSITRIGWEDVRSLPNLKSIIFIVLFSAFANWYVEETKSDKITEKNNEISIVKENKIKLEKDLLQQKVLEDKKKAYERDAEIIRTKLEAIEKLMTDRSIPVQVLIALSNSIPKNVWITDFKVSNSDIDVSGQSLDFNQVSKFLKNLNESVFFKDIVLKSTQQDKDETGTEVAKFELQVRRR